MVNDNEFYPLYCEETVVMPNAWSSVPACLVAQIHDAKPTGHGANGGRTAESEPVAIASERPRYRDQELGKVGRRGPQTAGGQLWNHSPATW